MRDRALDAAFRAQSEARQQEYRAKWGERAAEQWAEDVGWRRRDTLSVLRVGRGLPIRGDADRVMARGPGRTWLNTNADAEADGRRARTLLRWIARVTAVALVAIVPLALDVWLRSHSASAKGPMGLPYGSKPVCFLFVLCLPIEKRTAGEIQEDIQAYYIQARRAVLPQIVRTEAMMAGAAVLLIEAARLSTRPPPRSGAAVGARRFVVRAACAAEARWFPISLLSTLLLVAEVLRRVL